MDAGSWIIAISVIIIAVAFVVLVIFLVMMLVSVKKTVESAERMCRDLHMKVDAFDPYFRVITHLGNALEKASISENLEERVGARLEKSGKIVDIAIDATNWAMIGLSLWKKITGGRG